MATLECDHETVAGVTLVECRLASDLTERVTVEPTHDGPIWPPRRQGVPAAGWTDDGWTGTVPAEGYRALGYATPAQPADDPARISATAQPESDEAVSARDVIRSLGDPTPTRDAVPPATDAETGRDRSDLPSTEAPDPSVDSEGAPTERPSAPESADAAADRGADRSGRQPESQSPGDTGNAADQPLTPEAALDAIETRLWTARDLAEVSTVEEAREAVDRAGGLPAVRELSSQLEADRDRLATLEERTSRLAAEAAAVEVPVGSLERLV
jgi:hypothetical protein